MNSIPWIILAGLIFWVAIVQHGAGKGNAVQIEVICIEGLLFIIIAYLAAILNRMGK